MHIVLIYKYKSTIFSAGIGINDSNTIVSITNKAHIMMTANVLINLLFF
ncbi:MAG: hypothetical protein FWG84_04935 [Bacteroidales bacterium]|nr:hypothetical protein [Bacteroidales bacterium]